MKKTNCNTDCFASKDGRCVCLSDVDFGGGSCPFYKCRDEVSLDDIEEDIRLYKESGKGDE